MRRQTTFTLLSMNARSIRVALSTLCAFCVFCGPSSAALDPEADKPYDLHIVLHFAEHRVFTPVFRERVERELRDHMRTALGSLVNVNVVREHPLLDEIRAKGLRTVLDAMRLTSDTKTHFVLLDYADGQYEIQSRQHDGPTGLVTPEVRRTLLADRELVARAAALMVQQDFGALGTLAAPGGSVRQGEKVTLTLKGQRLGGPLDRLVQKGDVFVLAQISQGPAGLRAALVPGTVLQVVEGPRDGACMCQLYFRYDPPLPGGQGVLGYRCLKLPTTEARLRLRLVPGEPTRQPLGTLNVTLSQSRDGATEEPLTTDRNDAAQSKGPYRHLAFVSIARQGVSLTAPFPVPVLGDAVVTLPVPSSPDAEQRGLLEGRLRELLNELYEAQLANASLIKEFNQNSAKAPKAALDAARKRLEGIEKYLGNLNNKLFSLQEEARKSQVNLHGTPAVIEQGVRDLRKSRETVETRMKEFAEAIARENDPKIQQLKALLVRAAALEDDLDIDAALALYEKVLAEAPTTKELKERVAKLKDEWKPRDEQHDNARAFIYQTWPRVTTAAGIEEHLPKAKEAFHTCRDAGDLFSCRKLLRVSRDLVVRLGKELEGLKGQANEDARLAAEVIVKAAKDLGNLIAEVNSFVNKS